MTRHIIPASFELAYDEEDHLPPPPLSVVWEGDWSFLKLKLIHHYGLQGIVLEGDVEGFAWLKLFDHDLQAMQIAYHDYRVARHVSWKVSSVMLSQPNGLEPLESWGQWIGARARISYSATSFVSAAARVGRWIEKLNARRSIFPQDIADIIRQEAAKRRKLFGELNRPRGAIYHMEEEIRRGRARHIYRMLNHNWHVTEQLNVTVDYTLLDSALRFRTAIIEASLPPELTQPTSGDAN